MLQLQCTCGNTLDISKIKRQGTNYLLLKAREPKATQDSYAIYDIRIGKIIPPGCFSKMINEELESEVKKIISHYEKKS
jgi:hypothetical protein